MALDEGSSPDLVTQNPTADLCQSVIRPLGEREIPRDCFGFHHSFGIDTRKRHNIHYIDTDLILTACGNTVQFIRTC